MNAMDVGLRRGTRADPKLRAPGPPKPDHVAGFRVGIHRVGGAFMLSGPTHSAHDRARKRVAGRQDERIVALRRGIRQYARTAVGRCKTIAWSALREWGEALWQGR